MQKEPGFIGTDKSGNRWYLFADHNMFLVDMPDGRRGQGWTQREALEDACAKEPKIKLPEFCYSMLPDTGEWIVLKRYVSEYIKMNWDKATQEAIDAKNELLGVTKAQEAAMKSGLLFGWGCKRADPNFYDDNGIPKAVGKYEQTLDQGKRDFSR